MYPKNAPVVLNDIHLTTTMGKALSRYNHQSIRDELGALNGF
jgi:hypothetical protein